MSESATTPLLSDPSSMLETTSPNGYTSASLEAAETAGRMDDPSSVAASGDSLDAWRQWLIRRQRQSVVAAHFLALTCVLVVIWWIHELGGLSWTPGDSPHVFNWHPMLMVTAYAFMTVASLSFRSKGRILVRPNLSKTIHAVAWAVAFLCMTVGLVAVLRSHNDGISGYIANLYSLHSWIGVSVVCMYSLQFLSGVTTFGFPSVFGLTESFKGKVLLVHYYVGPMIYLGVMATILLGLQEKEGFVGCAYKVHGPDLFPPAHFFEIPLACRISHLLGLTVLLTGVCTSFALHPIDRGTYRQN